MRRFLKIGVFVAIIIVVSYFALGYFSSYIGWFGYEKWKDRKASTSIAESKRRGVFIKNLNFNIEGYSDSLKEFQPFIEKGFKWGQNTSEETVFLTNTQFPYQLSFNYRPNQFVTITIKEDQLSKFDSSNSSWGYLKNPSIRDTIILSIGGNNIPAGSAIIKVW